MASSTRTRQVDSLVEKAEQAEKAGMPFEAERLYVNAITVARQAADFVRLRQILIPLWAVRRERVNTAIDIDEVTIVDHPVDDEIVVESGCYVIQPPQVGADARRLRLAALDQDVPVAVVCREPITLARLWPVVAIGPGITLRTTIPPPPDRDAPDMDWFVDAMNELAHFAVESLDPALTTIRRLDALLQRLDVIPDHPAVHEALSEVCAIASDEFEPENTPPPPRRPQRSGNPSRRSNRPRRA